MQHLACGSMELNPRLCVRVSDTQGFSKFVAASLLSQYLVLFDRQQAASAVLVVPVPVTGVHHPHDARAPERLKRAKRQGPLGHSLPLCNTT
jgi:hypothetical protein